VTCPSLTRVNFPDVGGGTASFFLNGTAVSWTHGSSTSNLTGSEVSIMNLTFICTLPSGTTLASVVITITASDVKTAGAEGAQIIKSSTVYLRNY
jgi:hypothetical protein